VKVAPSIQNSDEGSHKFFGYLNTGRHKFFGHEISGTLIVRARDS
jgi:hypothetical protein